MRRSPPIRALSLEPVCESIVLQPLFSALVSVVYMTSELDPEHWDYIDSPSTMPPTIEEQSQNLEAQAAHLEPEATTNTKRTELPSTAKPNPVPQFKRIDTMDSINSEGVDLFRHSGLDPLSFEDEFLEPHRHSRTARHMPPPPRPHIYSSSPPRRSLRSPSTPLFNSSTTLLNHLNHDGIVDLPWPGKSSIYLTTFPFSDKDVQEWAWILRSGVEEQFIQKHIESFDEDGGSEDEWYPSDRRIRIHRPNRVRRERSPFYDDTADIPSVYLSRALDPEVISEEEEKDFTYVVVVRNRRRGSGCAKMLTAGGRKAAGIIIYYEVLIGNSVVFVGAAKGGVGKKGVKYKRVESVDEAVKVAEEGIFGIIC